MFSRRESNVGGHEGFMKGALNLFLCFALTFLLFAPFSNAVEANILSPQDGSDAQYFYAAEDTAESQDLPIYVHINPDLSEITLINEHSIPADLDIVALDYSGHEIARWPLHNFSSTEGMTLNLADIFGVLTAGRIASVKVVADEPFRISEANELSDTAAINSLGLGFIYPGTEILTASSNSPYANYPLNAFYQYKGECTWYVYGRAIEIVRKGYLPTNVENIMHDAFWNRSGRDAKNWLSPLFLGGRFATGNIPKIGAIAQWTIYNGDGGHGHVAFVENVSGDSYLISDFNRKAYHTYGTVEFTTSTDNKGSEPTFIYLTDSVPTTCSDFGEPNGSFSAAYGLNCGTTSTAKICSSSDVDYYKVTPSSSGTMTITLTPPSDKDYDLYIYNSSQQQICSSVNGTGVQDRCSPSVTGGQTYYIKVMGYSGAYSTTSNYSLAISCPSSTAPTLRIDGGTSSTKSQGSTFYLTGSYYTPNGTVSRYLTRPGESEVAISSITANSSGNISWSFTSSCSDKTGTYYIRAKDNSTGKFSNSVTEIITFNYSCDKTIPNVTALSVSPTSNPVGKSFTISYSVKDSGGSGLKQVELWRQPNGGSWSQIKTTTLLGQTSYSGTFSNAPSSAGTYWYGLHVVDRAGNWNDEKNSRTGYSPGQYGPDKVVVYNLPTLRIDGGTSSTRSQGSTFYLTGSYYTPNGAVTRYLKQPDGTTITLSPTLYANSSGNISWSFTPSCSTRPGTYYLWVKDNATGRTSNTVTEIVTRNSSCYPTLYINGGTSSTKSQGGTFTCTGWNYTPNGAVTRYLKQPNGSTITLSPTLYANSNSYISWSFTSSCSNGPGTYYLWVKDNGTGRYSNTVTEIITHSSSCP